MLDKIEAEILHLRETKIKLEKSAKHSDDKIAAL